MPLLAFSIADNSVSARQSLGRVQQQIPFAASQTVNKLAKMAVKDLKAEMRKAFKDPKSYTLNAFYAHGGMKQSPGAEILARDFGKGTPGWKYLTPEVFGGTRAMKRFERALEAHFGSGESVPGRGAPLTTGGALSQGFVMKLLSALGAAESRAGYRANRRNLSKRQRSARGTDGTYRHNQFFLAHAKGDGSLLGIYQIVGSGKVEPVLIFPHRRPMYARRLPYFETLEQSVSKNASRVFSQELRFAMATSKPKE